MKYTESHEWIVLEGNVGVVGITDYAQKELGEIVYVELPKVGAKIKAGEEACVLESTKAAADIYSPVSGKVIAVNESLKSNVQKINQSAEKEGWLFKIELADKNEYTNLMGSAEYQNLID